MISGQESNHHAGLPLLVSMEHGLFATALAWEAFCLMLSRNPLLLFMLPVWLRGGTGRVSTELLARFSPDPRLLPCHRPLLDYLRAEKQAGRRLVLATALPAELGRQTVQRLGLFDDLAVLDGAATSAALPPAYIYVGCAADEEAARRAAAVVLVKRSGIGHGRPPAAVIKTILPEAAGWRTYVQAARMHQWLKNLLIFIPLVTAHRIGETELLLRALCAFFSFSLCASAIYLLNDLIDLSADRQHRSKCNRPLASGRMLISSAVAAIPLLVGAAFVLGSLPGPLFLSILAFYILLTTLYSCWLKRLVMVDVVVLALLYTLRLLAGGAAVGIMPSFWLLSFSMFIFFSLALMKRSADLVLGRSGGQNSMEGRGYLGSDGAIVQMCGVASGYLSVLVLALYINSEDVRLLYTHPELIWLLCPLLFYWISRVWLITSRGAMTDDPVLFAIRDRVSQGVAGAAAIILWIAT